VTTSPAPSVALHPPKPFAPMHLGFPHEPSAAVAGAGVGAGGVPVPASLAAGASSAGVVAGAGVEGGVDEAVASPPEPAAFVASGDRVVVAERPRWSVAPSEPPEQAVTRSAVIARIGAKKTRMFFFPSASVVPGVRAARGPCGPYFSWTHAGRDYIVAGLGAHHGVTRAIQAQPAAKKILRPRRRGGLEET
jgi:hypothetical protein